MSLSKIRRRDVHGGTVSEHHMVELSFEYHSYRLLKHTHQKSRMMVMGSDISPDGRSLLYCSCCEEVPVMIVICTGNRVDHIRHYTLHDQGKSLGDDAFVENAARKASRCKCAVLTEEQSTHLRAQLLLFRYRGRLLISAKVDCGKPRENCARNFELIVTNAAIEVNQHDANGVLRRIDVVLTCADGFEVRIEVYDTHRTKPNARLGLPYFEVRAGHIIDAFSGYDSKNWDSSKSIHLETFDAKPCARGCAVRAAIDNPAMGLYQINQAIAEHKSVAAASGFDCIEFSKDVELFKQAMHVTNHDTARQRKPVLRWFLNGCSSLDQSVVDEAFWCVDSSVPFVFLWENKRSEIDVVQTLAHAFAGDSHRLPAGRIPPSDARDELVQDLVKAAVAPYESADEMTKSTIRNALYETYCKMSEYDPRRYLQEMSKLYTPYKFGRADDGRQWLSFAKNESRVLLRAELLQRDKPDIFETFKGNGATESGDALKLLAERAKSRDSMLFQWLLSNLPLPSYDHRMTVLKAAIDRESADFAQPLLVAGDLSIDDAWTMPFTEHDALKMLRLGACIANVPSASGKGALVDAILALRESLVRELLAKGASTSAINDVVLRKFFDADRLAWDKRLKEHRDCDRYGCQDWPGVKILLELIAAKVPVTESMGRPVDIRVNYNCSPTVRKLDEEVKRQEDIRVQKAQQEEHERKQRWEEEQQQWEHDHPAETTDRSDTLRLARFLCGKYRNLNLGRFPIADFEWRIQGSESAAVQEHFLEWKTRVLDIQQQVNAEEERRQKEEEERRQKEEQQRRAEEEQQRRAEEERRRKEAIEEEERRQAEKERRQKEAIENEKRLVAIAEKRKRENIEFDLRCQAERKERHARLRAEALLNENESRVPHMGYYFEEPQDGGEPTVRQRGKKSKTEDKVVCHGAKCAVCHPESV